MAGIAAGCLDDPRVNLRQGDVAVTQGTSGGTFATVSTLSGTSFTDTSLTASTSYRYQVRARDAAGNTSAVSNTVPVTTSGGGGGGGGACSAAYRVTNSWQGAYQGEVVVTNRSTATLNGWTVTLTTSPTITITQIWGGTFTASGNTITIKPLSYTANPAPNASVSLGFIANVSGSAGATGTTTCTSP